MRCSKVGKLIAFHLYGELPDKTKQVLEQHLKRCSSCRRTLEEWQTIVDRAAQRGVLAPSQHAVDIVRHAADIALKDRALHQYRVLWDHRSYGPRIGIAVATFSVVVLVAAALMVKIGWRNAFQPNEPIQRTVSQEPLMQPPATGEYMGAGSGEAFSPGSFDAHLADLEADALYVRHQMASDMAPLLDRRVQSVAHAVLALEEELE